MQENCGSSRASRGPRLCRFTVACGAGALLFTLTAAPLQAASTARDGRDKESSLGAPITGVTVYSDRARVVRSARLQLGGDGVERFVLPLLPPRIDASSIRIDARPAGDKGEVDVERVEITRVTGSELSADETQGLLDSLEQLDDQLARLNEERAVYQSHLELLGRLTPAAPPTPAVLGGGKPAPLNPAGWSAVFGFLRGAMERLHGALADNAEKSRQLGQKRDKLLAEVRLLGGGQQRSAYRVTATLRGHGAAVLWLSYMTPNARWQPTYDIQLVPGRNQVELAFSGQVSQETGEDWNDVALVLSTAVPSLATQAPKLLTWKLGARERFIPTPTPLSERPPEPPPPPLSPIAEVPQAALLRRRLLDRAGLGAGPTGKVERAPIGGEGKDVAEDGLLEVEDEKKAKEKTKREPRKPMAQSAPPPPPAEPAPLAAPVVRARSYESISQAAPGAMAEYLVTQDAEALASVSSTSGSSIPPQVVGVGLAPPPGYRPPPLGASSPAALAGGYDLSYSSLYKETLGSGKGARRVALFSRSFPVSVQRKVFAALAKEAYLVAEINNPAQEPLPGGQAQLFVGADPAGVATLQLVAPGEAFTLPLGLDRALKPVRNVRLSTVEKGVFSKDELSEYLVTTELSNPYRQAIDVRLFDQVPLVGDKNVEIKLVSSEPPATADRNTGALEWRLTVPPGGKIETRFIYTLRRPKGARLYQ